MSRPSRRADTHLKPGLSPGPGDLEIREEEQSGPRSAYAGGSFFARSGVLDRLRCSGAAGVVRVCVCAYVGVWCPFGGSTVGCLAIEIRGAGITPSA